MGLCHAVLTNPQSSTEKLTVTVVEMQQLADIKKTDSKTEVSCLKWTIYNGRRKLYVNFQIDTDKLNFVVYCYRNSLYLKDNEVDLKVKEYQSLLANVVYLLSSLTYSTSGALYRMKQLFKNKTNLARNGCSFPNEHFPISPGIKNVIWTQ